MVKLKKFKERKLTNKNIHNYFSNSKESRKLLK